MRTWSFRQFGVDSAWALAGRLGTKVSGFVVAAVLARELVPDDYGAYLVVVSVAGLFAFVADLGLAQAIVLLVARDEADGDHEGARHHVASAARLLALGSVIATLIAISPIGHELIDELADRETALAFAALVAVLGSVRAAQLFTGEVFRGYSNIPRASVYGEALPATLVALAIAVGALQSDLGLTGAVVLSTVAPLAAVCAGVFALRRAFVTMPAGAGVQRSTARGSPRRVFAESWPLFGHRIASYLTTQLDLWLSSVLLGGVAAATYGAAARTLLFFDLPLVVSNLAFAPRIARALRHDAKEELQLEIRRVATIVGTVGWLSLALVVLLREPLVELVFGDRYREGAAPIVLILAVGHAFFYWSGPSALTLIMGGEQRALLAISAATAVVLGGAAWVLGELEGLEGVAAAAAGATALHNVATWYAVRRRLGLATNMSWAELTGLRAERKHAP